MKKLIYSFIITIICTNNAVADDFLTSCPSGFSTVNIPSVQIHKTCPSGTTKIATAKSCNQNSPESPCFLFIPSDTPYTDTIGTFQYSEPCVLSN